MSDLTENINSTLDLLKDIDSRLSSNEITEEEAKQLIKEHVMDIVDDDFEFDYDDSTEYYSEESSSSDDWDDLDDWGQAHEDSILDED